MAIRNPLVPLVLGALALALASSPALTKDKQKLAEVTKKDLISKVPNFFSFEIEGDQDSKRLWLRIDNKHFIERYPSGGESKFKVLGRTKVEGMADLLTRERHTAGVNALKNVELDLMGCALLYQVKRQLRLLDASL